MLEWTMSSLELTQSCLEYIRTTGLFGFSIGELASAVEMSKSGLYASFGSKEALQMAILDMARKQFTNEVVAPSLLLPRGLPRIQGISEAWTSWALVPGGCPFIAWSAELDDRAGPLREALRSSQRDWVDFLENACRIAVDEGHFRSDLDPETWAYEFFALHTASQHYHRLLEHPKVNHLRGSAVARLINASKISSG